MNEFEREQQKANRIAELEREVKDLTQSRERLQFYCLVVERAAGKSVADLRRFYNVMVVPDQRLKDADIPPPDNA